MVNVNCGRLKLKMSFKVLTSLLILIYFNCPVLTEFFNFSNNACTTLSSYYIRAISKDCYYNPDVLSNVVDMTRRHNYKIKTYKVETSDGYFLSLFRISLPNVQKSTKPVFLQHGILTSSACWVDIGNDSLAFNLADLGYDVWLGNVRGTTYSNKHVKYTVSDKEFWDFNLDKMARIDISVQLNFVANITGKYGKIIYIGHSMGTTLAFMYFSEMASEAHSLVEGFVALAPVVYLNDLFLLNLIKPLSLTLVNILNAFDVYGIFYQEQFIHKFITDICEFVPRICTSLLVDLGFGRSSQFPPEYLLIFYSYWPTGTSTNQLKQYLQISNSGKFKKFDYGRNGNLKVYDTIEPPVYNLSNIKLPLRIYYGKKDILYNEANLERLFQELGSTNKVIREIPSQGNGYYDFGHGDFIYGKYVKKFLYRELFEDLNSEFKNTNSVQLR